MLGARIQFLFKISFCLLWLIRPCLSCGGLHNPHALSQYPYLLHGMAKVNATEDDFPSRIANWLQYYNSSILAGSFMPDWGYGCSGNDDLSETMHWPPFLKAAVEHVRETYPNPATNSKAQALIAFLFGVAGHQVQDAAWHSIGLLMGFIDEVSKVECASYGFAHETLDWGGETVLGKRYTGMKGAVDWAFGDWVVPVDDLAAIYNRMGKHLGTWDLRYCSIRLRASMLAAARGAFVLHPRYGQRSPFMLDHFDEYYLGGIDDMTATTVECWTNLTNWFRNGEIGDPWELCPLTKAITRRTESPPCLPEALRKRLEAEAHEIESQFNIVEESGFLKISYTGPRRIPEQEDAEQMSIDKKKEDPPPFTRNFSIDVRFARFGQSMAIGEFGIGNPLQIAVSSPFETLESHSPYVGEVHVLSVSETDGIVPSSALHPSHSSFDIPGIRFGFSLASLKIHRKHGHISALAVGTPGWNPAGRVFLYTADGSSTLDIIPKLTIVPYDEAKIQFRSRYGKRALGTKLFVADIDGDGQDDLLIASPWSDFVPPQNETQMWDQQSGRIAVFTGPQLAEFMIGGTEILDEDCAYKISCPTGSGFERFGTSMAFAERAAVLLVGEPGFGRDSHIVGSGKVYGIKIIKGEPKTVFQIDGPEVEQGDLPTEFGGGGLTSGITKEGIEWIAIAAHNENVQEFRQAGKVYIYTLSEIVSVVKNTTSYKVDRAITLHAEQSELFGKFGAVLATDGRDTLWISSGSANEEDGLVWSYNVGKQLAKARHDDWTLENQIQHVFHAPKADNATAKVFAKGQHKKARFGDSLLVADLNDDGFPDLVVGSPFYHGEQQASPLTGKIDIFFT